MPTELSEGSKGDSHRLSGITKNPLAVLLVGTVLGSVLVPTLSQHAARMNEFESLRLRKALAALEASRSVDHRLNLLLTTIGEFWQDPDETTREARRHELRAKVSGLYEEIDVVGWWWFDEAWQEAKILNLLDEDEALEAKRLAKQYKLGLAESTRAISSVWSLSLSPRPVSTAEAKKALLQARQTVDLARHKCFQSTAKFASILLRRSWLGGAELEAQRSGPRPGPRSTSRIPGEGAGQELLQAERLHLPRTAEVEALAAGTARLQDPSGQGRQRHRLLTRASGS